MKVVTVRGRPDELHARLKERARENRRSLNQQILVELAAPEEDARVKGRAERLIALSREMRKKIAHPLTASEIRAGIREGRK
jgi:predicted transcriptional regulator